jgi:hypothetical protein
MSTRRAALEDAFWARHSNPKSGWSRTAVLPALLYATYRRDWRLVAAVVAFAAVNPLLFAAPEDDEAWMTRVVLAERWWRETDRGFLDRSYPNVLNVCNAPVTLYATVAAYRGRPVRSALACGAAMALKFWYVAELVRRYEDESE